MTVLPCLCCHKSNRDRVITTEYSTWYSVPLSTLAWIDKPCLVHTKTCTDIHIHSHSHTKNIWIFRKTGLQWNSVDIIRMESQVESPLSNCLVEMIITQQYLVLEKDSDRLRVKRAHLLYEDYSSKFDSCSHLQMGSTYGFKCLLIFPKITQLKHQRVLYCV